MIVVVEVVEVIVPVMVVFHSLVVGCFVPQQDYFEVLQFHDSVHEKCSQQTVAVLLLSKWNVVAKRQKSIS